MTTSEQLQKELNEMNAKRNELKKAFTVECEAPKMKRTYSYRKSPIIKASDVCSL